MILELRNKVSEYVAKNADIDNWESVREMFGLYSYLAFLCIVTRKIIPVRSLSDVVENALIYKIETKSILEMIKKIKEADSFVVDVIDIISIKEITDIEKLYQDYLCEDFKINEGKVFFENGKNNRDVLGSYYTQKEFAQVITNKAFDDYLSQNDAYNKLVIADYSCGGSAFLISAYNLCTSLRIEADIYGYDVDPIAVIISRLRFVFNSNKKVRIIIILGNPLLPCKGDCSEKFIKAVSGRYYNEKMGIEPVKNVDIILGNPPWEKVRFEEKKFLNHFFLGEDVGTKNNRERLVKSLEKNNLEYYSALISDYDNSKKFFKRSEWFKKSSCGEINTYALFTELCTKLIKPSGIVSLIVKSSLVKMQVYKVFFEELINGSGLYNIFLFTNQNKIFSIDSREEFSVIYLSSCKTRKLEIALNLSNYNEMKNCRMISVSCKDLNLINRETGMIPNIKNIEDLQFLIKMSSDNKTFGEVYNECRFGRLVHLTNHSEMIKNNIEPGYLPIYEGKFIELYTSKYATYRGMRFEEKYRNKASAKLILNPESNEYPESRYFIEEQTWNNISKHFEKTIAVMWRSLTSATNRRTMIATIMPLVPTCQSIQILQLKDERQMLHILALFNSIIFDYIVRLKMVGLDLTQTIIKQVPVPDLEQYDVCKEYKRVNATFSEHIISRLKVLYQDDERLSKIFKNYKTYDVTGNRKEIISDIDHIVANLYRINDDELKKIAQSFNSFYSKNELATYF